MSGTSNVSNQGIWHAAPQYGMKPLCGNRRAHIVTLIAKFRDLPAEDRCKRCAAKLADMDGRVAKRAA